MAKEATTIYIDDSAIWVLVARGRQVRKWATMPLEPGLIKDGVILNEDDIVRKVRELWRAENIGARRVIAAISGINCLYRLLTLPELPRDLFPEAVRREASRVLGVPLEQVYLSWQILPSIRGESSVYLVALPRNSVDSLISTLRKARLDPYLMDLKPLALARTTTESRAIIIDLQPASFDIVVMAEGIPHVVRSLSLPREASLEGKIPTVAGELDRAITFYNSGHMDKPIEPGVPLLVSGELAKQEDAWELLAGRQPRPVQVLPSPMETPGSFPSSQYTTNIGLALKQLTPEKGAAHSLVNLNALPEVYRPKPRSISEILLVPTIVVGIVLVAFGAFANITASAYTTDLHAELANINQMIISREVRAQDIIALTKKVSSLEETADAFTTTLDGFKVIRDEVNGDLVQIITCLPETVDLTSVRHSSDSITMEGTGDDEHAVFRYAENLRASGRFALVVITDMHQEAKAEEEEEEAEAEAEEQQLIGFTFTLTK